VNKCVIKIGGNVTEKVTALEPTLI